MTALLVLSCIGLATAQVRKSGEGPDTESLGEFDSRVLQVYARAEKITFRNGQVWVKIVRHFDDYSDKLQRFRSEPTGWSAGAQVRLIFTTEPLGEVDNRFLQVYARAEKLTHVNGEVWVRIVRHFDDYSDALQRFRSTLSGKLSADDRGEATGQVIYGQDVRGRVRWKFIEVVDRDGNTLGKFTVKQTQAAQRELTKILQLIMKHGT
jgi:hypothetical protein